MVRVTLIDKNNYHPFQPFLHQVAPAELDTGDVPNSIRQSLRRHANGNVKMLEVIGANPRICTVTNREGHSYQGDFLAAAGSQSDFFGTAVAQEKRLPPVFTERSPNGFGHASWPFLRTRTAIGSRWSKAR